MPIDYEDVQKLVRIISEVSREIPFLRVYDNCMEISKRGGYYTNSRVLYRIRINDAGATAEGQSYSYKSEKPNVAFICFEQMHTLSWLKRFLTDRSYNRGYARRGYENSSAPMQDLFMVYPRDLNNSLGINVSRDIKIRGNLYNIIKFKNEIIGYDSYSDNAAFKSVHTLFWVGSNHAFLGLMLSSGKIIFRFEAIRNILKNNDEAKCKAMFKKLFIYIDKFHNLQNSMQIKDIEPVISEQLFRETISSLSDSNLSLTRSGNIDTAQLIKTVESVAKNLVDTRLAKTIFGANSDYSYSRLIKKILDNQENMTRHLVQKSFHDGMKFALKLEMIGWRLNKNVEFTDARQGDIWWEKDVEIVPDSFIKGDKRYEIPKKYRKWKITKLYVSQNGRMRCDGAHPNVSGKKVCMGDLKIEWEAGDEKLKDSLLRAESLLDIINYDSAYSYVDQEKLSKHGIALDVYDETAVSKLRKATPSIRRFGELNTEDKEPDIAEPVINQTEVMDETGDTIGVIMEEEFTEEQRVSERRNMNRDRRNYGINRSIDGDETEVTTDDIQDYSSLTETLYSQVTTTPSSFRDVDVQVLDGPVVAPSVVTHSLSNNEMTNIIQQIQDTGLMLTDDDIQQANLQLTPDNIQVGSDG